MNVIRVAILAMLLCLSVRASEEVLKATQFELQDGRNLITVRYSTNEVDGRTVYTIVTLDGQKVIVPSAEIKARHDLRLSASKLSPPMRQEMTGNRALSSRDTPATQSARAGLNSAKGHERELRVRLKGFNDELAHVQTQLAAAERAVHDTPEQIAVTDAKYDAAKAAMAGAQPYYPGFVSPRNLNPTALAREMQQAAVLKVRLTQSLADSTAAVKDLGARAKTLAENIAATEQDIAAAHDAVLAAQERLHNARNAPPAPPPDATQPSDDKPPRMEDVFPK